MMEHSDGDGRQQFQSWLQRNGAIFPKLRFRNDSMGGLDAVSEILPQEIFLQVPAHLIITPKRCCEYSKLVKNACDKHPHIFSGIDDNVLILFVMVERLLGKESFWAPYLDQLPQNPEVLAEWMIEELDQLQDQDLSLLAQQRHIYSRRRYDDMIAPLCKSEPEMYPLDKFSKPLFTWAAKIIQSRAFGRRLKSNALIPLADNLNHNAVCLKYDFDVNKNGMFRMFYTGSDGILKGQQAYNSYGRINNALLLLNYGFTLRNNNQDEVAISLDFETIRSVRLPLHNEESTRERSLDKSKLLLGVLFDQGEFFLSLAAISYDLLAACACVAVPRVASYLMDQYEVMKKCIAKYFPESVPRPMDNKSIVEDLSLPEFEWTLVLTEQVLTDNFVRICQKSNIDADLQLLEMLETCSCKSSISTSQLAGMSAKFKASQRSPPFIISKDTESNKVTSGVGNDWWRSTSTAHPSNPDILRINRLHYAILYRMQRKQILKMHITCVRMLLALTRMRLLQTDKSKSRISTDTSSEPTQSCVADLISTCPETLKCFGNKM